MSAYIFLVPLLFLSATPVPAQVETVKLKVHALLVDRDLNQKPVPKLTLVLQRLDVAASEPSTIKTGFDGVAEVQLPAGKYRLSTPQPVDLQGKSYRWEFEFTLSGPERTLELSNDNAKISEATPERPARATDELTTLFKRLQNSVVTVWSEDGHGSGFFVDAKGLVLTNQHVVENSEYVAIQFDERRKVVAVVLAADPKKDVAVLWADVSPFPEVVVAPLAKAEGGEVPVVEGERVFTIGSPLHQRKILTTGVVSKVEPRSIISDININPGNSGGPLFRLDGRVVGLTAFGERGQRGAGISGIVRIEEALPLLEQARTKMAAAAPPAATLLPVEPTDPYPVAAIKVALQAEKFDRRPYYFDAGDFEVMLGTPLLEFRLKEERRLAAEREKQKRGKQRGEAAQEPPPVSEGERSWGKDVGESESVISIVVKPKLKMKFWETMASGRYGLTKMRFKTDFYKMRLLCGSREIQPIHPGRYPLVGGKTQSVEVTDSTYIGIYSYLPDAIAPSCGQVVLEVYPAKNSPQPTVKVLESASVERIWSDFEAYRKAGAAPQ